MQEEGSEGGRRDLISHAHAWFWMAIPGKPSARLTHDLRLVTGQRCLRFSILKETPAPLQDHKMVFGQGCSELLSYVIRIAQLAGA